MTAAAQTRAAITRDECQTMRRSCKALNRFILLLSASIVALLLWSVQNSFAASRRAEAVDTALQIHVVQQIEHDKHLTSTLDRLETVQKQIYAAVSGVK